MSSTANGVVDGNRGVVSRRRAAHYYYFRAATPVSRARSGRAPTRAIVRAMQVMKSDDTEGDDVSTSTNTALWSSFVSGHEEEGDDHHRGGASAGGVLGRRRAGLAAVTAAAGLSTLAAAASPAPARASAAAKLDAVVELTPDNFTKEVEGPNAGRVFVEFYAPWCPFCQRLEPTWNELPSKLAAANVDTKIARMNVDTYVDYGQAYGVTGFPTLMLFQDGRPVGQKTGLIDMATAMKYAGVKDQGVLASLSGPPPQMNLVLTGPQVDQALEELGALRREMEALPEGERAAAVERIRAVETLFAKRSL